jgi:Virulence factor
MATYRILYWQEIPSQIVVADDEGEVNLPLPQRFLEQIDAEAVARGFSQGDDYLAQWRWGDDRERAGPAAEVAQQVLAELEAEASW